MFFRRLLLPFSWIYALVTMIRNKMFDIGKLPSASYSLPVISVGNITVGGTGKTPLTEYLIRWLQPHYQVALLSRGYGRKSSGVVLADDCATYHTIGDEPMQMKQKFPHLTVVVAEKRTLGMETLLQQNPTPQIVVMDDAYQHRYVKPGLSILITDYYRPMWKDFCFPAGNLREPASGIHRAQIVIVSKCPKNLSYDEAQMIKRKLKISSHQKLYFTSIDYGPPVQVSSVKVGEQNFVDVVAKSSHHLTVVAGIGNPQPFFNRAKMFGLPIKAMQYKDHHHFTFSDIREIEKSASVYSDDLPGLILTTEKDAVRLMASDYVTEELLQLIWYIPIQPRFLFEGETSFNESIMNYIKRFNK